MINAKYSLAAHVGVMPRATALLAGATLFSLSTIATAQKAEDAGADIGLEEIVVTAQRKEETLQRAAIAIDVVSSDELAQQGIGSTAQLNQAVPSLTVQSVGGANTVYFVRGVGNFAVNGFSDPALAFNIDGVYVGRATGSAGGFFDLQRIEVLKGPQGTLYGRNATAGAINVVPNRPVLNEFSGEAEIGYGNFNAKNVEAALNVPLGTETAFRLAATYSKHDGYNNDGTSDENAKAIRGQVLFQPNDSFNIRLAGDYAKQGGVGSGAHIDGHYSPVFGAPVGGYPSVTNVFAPSNLPIDSGYFSPDSQAVFAGYFIGGANNTPEPMHYPFQDNNFWGVNAELNWITSAGTLTFLPAYREINLDQLFNGPTFRAGWVEEGSKQTSVEARFQAARLGIFDTLLGAYYFDETVSGLNSYDQYVVNALIDYTSKTKSTAFFGRLTANLTDQVRLVLGARHTKDEKSMDAYGVTVVQGCGAFPPPAPLTAPPTFCFGSPSLPVVLRYSDDIANGTIAPTPNTPQQLGANPNAYTFWSPYAVVQSPTFSKNTFRFAGEWDVADGSLLYASYETGYRSGGFSIAPGRETFQPETIKAITLGSKNRLFGNRLELNLELFHWKYSNQQVSHFGADGDGHRNLFTENIGNSTIKGADFEGRFLATDTTLVTSSLQYLDAVVDRFSYRVLEQGAGVVTGCKATRVQDRDLNPFQPGNELEYVVDCAGKPSYNSPKWSFNFGVQQTVPLGAVDLVLNADTAYRSSSVTGFDYLPEQVTPAHWNSDASVEVRQPMGQWSISGYVRNIEAQRYKVSTWFSAASGNTVDSWYSAPRTYGVRLMTKF